MSITKQIIFLSAFCGLAAPLAADSNCAQRRALSDSRNRLAFAPDLFLRLDSNWPESGYGAEEVTYSRRAEVGIEYSAQDYLRAKIETELASLECLIPEGKLGSTQLTQAIYNRARMARLEAEVDQLSTHLGRFQDVSSRQRERYQLRSINVIEFDNSLARLQRVTAMLTDRQHELSTLSSQHEALKLLPPGREGQQRLLEASRGYLKLSKSLATLKKWNLTASVGRRVNERERQQQPSSFASVEFTFNLGTPLNLFSSEGDDIGPGDGLELKVDGIRQELSIVIDRLQLVQDVLSRVQQTKNESDDKAMEIFMRWLELKTNATGLQAELSALTGEPTASVDVADHESPTILNANESLSSVSDPTYRKVIPASNTNRASVKFRIRGTTAKLNDLGSGESRRQMGLMLRQTNQCNLVYVMIRLDEGRIVVQEKFNEGKSTHEECGNQGYSTVTPTFDLANIQLKLGQLNELDAAISKDQLTVNLNGKSVWRGPAPKILQAGANVGFRSDNLDIEYALTTFQE
jgi:hypothetical protein